MDNINVLWWLLFVFVGTILVVFFGQTLSKFFKWVWYSFFYMVVGAFGLYLINMGLHFIGENVPINLVTSLIAGLLGIPGIIALILIKLLILPI